MHHNRQVSIVLPRTSGPSVEDAPSEAIRHSTSNVVGRGSVVGRGHERAGSTTGLSDPTARSQNRPRPRRPLAARPIRVKMHGSELHAMLRVGLGAGLAVGSEEGLEANFEIAHGHDAVDGALAELGGEGEDLRGDLAQAAVLLF